MPKMCIWRKVDPLETKLSPPTRKDSKGPKREVNHVNSMKSDGDALRIRKGASATGFSQRKIVQLASAAF